MNRGRSRFKGWKQLKPFAAAWLFAGLSHADFAAEDAKTNEAADHPGIDGRV